MKDEVIRTLETVNILEKEVEKNLMLLCSKSKEHDKYREHTSKKIAGMGADHDRRVNDLLEELRDTEIKLESAEGKVQDFERVRVREARMQSAIDFSDIQAAQAGAPTPKQYHMKIRQLEEQLKAKDKEIKAIQIEVRAALPPSGMHRRKGQAGTSNPLADRALPGGGG